MRADVTVENPNEIQLTLTITLSLGEWRQIAGRLEDANDYWPWKGFAGVIRNAIKKADVRLTEIESVSNM